MTIKPFEIIKTEKVFDSKYMKLNMDTFVNHKGEQHEYFYETQQDVVHGLGIDENNNFVLSKEFRVPLRQEVIQVVGGVMDKEGESPEDCAKRELYEEAGYEGKEVISLGKACVNPARADYYMHEFLILDCKKITDPNGGEPSEVTEPFLLPIDEAWEYVRSGKIISCHSTSTIIKALLYLNISPTK